MRMRICKYAYMQEAGDEGNVRGTAKTDGARSRESRYGVRCPQSPARGGGLGSTHDMTEHDDSGGDERIR